MKISIVLWCLMTVFAGCINGCSSTGDVDQAKRVAATFFNDRLINGGAGSDGFYSQVFWDNTDAEHWRYVKKVVDESLGHLVSCGLVAASLQNQLPTSRLAGTFAVLVFETEYEKGRGLEKLTLLRRSRWSEFEIVGHQFESPQIDEMVLEGIAKAAEQNA